MKGNEEVNLDKRNNNEDIYELFKDRYGLSSEEEDNEGESWNLENEEEIADQKSQTDSNENKSIKILDSNKDPRIVMRDFNLGNFGFFRYPMLYVDINELEQVSHSYYKYEDYSKFRKYNENLNLKYINMAKIIPNNPFKYSSNIYMHELIDIEDKLYSYDQKITILNYYFKNKSEKFIRILKEYYPDWEQMENIDEFLWLEKNRLVSSKEKYLEINDCEYIKDIYDLYKKYNLNKFNDKIKNIYSIKMINNIIFKNIDEINNKNELNEIKINLKLKTHELNDFIIKPFLFINFQNKFVLNYTYDLVSTFINNLYQKELKLNVLNFLIFDLINLINEDDLSIDINQNNIFFEKEEVDSIIKHLKIYLKNEKINEDLSYNNASYQEKESYLLDFDIDEIKEKINKNEIFVENKEENYIINKLNIYQIKFLIIFHQIYSNILSLFQILNLNFIKNTNFIEYNKLLENLKNLIFINFGDYKFKMLNYFIDNESFSLRIQTLYQLLYSYLGETYFLDYSNEEQDNLFTMINQNNNIYFY